MIVLNKHYFGFSHFGVVRGSAFQCGVCTAPEGIFKGCSTVFVAFEGDWGRAANQNKRLVAKAMLHPSLSKKQRAAVHDRFLRHLDALENSGVDLPRAIDEVLAAAKEGKAIVDSINLLAHSLPNDEHVDPSKEEEKEERARMLAEAVQLSMQKDNPDALRRSKELRQRLIDDDVKRGNDTHDRAIFPIDIYRLGGLIEELPGLVELVEFSSEEYEVMPRYFKGARNYNASPVNFLGCTWNVKLGTANGKIYKIAAYVLLPSKREANPVATETHHIVLNNWGSRHHHQERASSSGTQLTGVSFYKPGKSPKNF